MKKFLALLLALAMVMCLFAGCGDTNAPADDTNTPADDTATPADDTTSTDDNSQYTIGYACGDMGLLFDNMLFEAAEKKANELGVKFVGMDAQHDNVMQIDQVNGMIAQGIDGLAINLVTTDAAAAVSKACEEAGVPVVYCNMFPWGDAVEENIPEYDYYVGSVEDDAGRLQANYLLELVGDQEVGVCIMQGVLGSSGALGRTAGNHEILDPVETVTILDEQTGNWLRDEATTLAENWITAHGDKLNVILCNNDEMALGCVNACKAAGRDDIIIMGVDATPDGLAAVKAGDMAATVLQDATNQAGHSVENALKLAKGESVPKVDWIPFVLVTPEDVDQYM